MIIEIESSCNLKIKNVRPICKSENHFMFVQILVGTAIIIGDMIMVHAIYSCSIIKRIWTV